MHHGSWHAALARPAVVACYEKNGATFGLFRRMPYIDKFSDFLRNLDVPLYWVMSLKYGKYGILQGWMVGGGEQESNPPL